MKKLDEAWKPQGPPGDFSSRVLDAWKQERAGRESAAVPRRSRARDVVLFSLGASLAACAALALWFSLRRKPLPEPIRPDDRRVAATASASSEPIPTAAAGPAPRPVGSADVLTVAPIEKDKQPPCKSQKVPNCTCQPTDPLCDCTPPNCPDLRVGDPPRERLGAAEVGAIVAMHKAELDNDCLPLMEKPLGPVTVTLGIAKSGRVNRVIVDGADDNPPFMTCLMTRVSNWEFPAALQSASASVPLVFPAPKGYFSPPEL